MNRRAELSVKRLITISPDAGRSTDAPGNDKSLIAYRRPESKCRSDSAYARFSSQKRFSQ